MKCGANEVHVVHPLQQQQWWRQHPSIPPFCSSPSCRPAPTWRRLDSPSCCRDAAPVEQVRNPIFTQKAFKWLHRLYSLFLCLTENLSGPRWPQLVSSGSLVRLLPRNRRDGRDRALHFSLNYVTNSIWWIGQRRWSLGNLQFINQQAVSITLSLFQVRNFSFRLNVSWT